MRARDGDHASARRHAGGSRWSGNDTGKVGRGRGPYVDKVARGEKCCDTGIGESNRNSDRHSTVGSRLEGEGVWADHHGERDRSFTGDRDREHSADEGGQLGHGGGWHRRGWPRSKLKVVGPDDRPCGEVVGCYGDRTQCWWLRPQRGQGGVGGPRGHQGGKQASVSPHLTGEGEQSEGRRWVRISGEVTGHGPTVGARTQGGRSSSTGPGALWAGLRGRGSGGRGSGCARTRRRRGAG